MSRWIDITPYAGGKKWGRGKPDYWSIYTGDKFKCSTVVSLFGGMDAIAGTMLERGFTDKVIVAEADASVRAVWECWANPDLWEDFYEAIDYWKDQFNINPVNSEKLVKDLIERAIAGEKLPTAMVAATQIAYRRMAFMALSRTSASGKLNVKLDLDGKLKTFQRWSWKFPPIEHGQIEVVDDFSKIFDLNVDWADTMAIVDPPYYYPIDPVGDAGIMKKRKLKTTMSPAYIGHEPHNADLTLHKLCLEPVAQLVDLGCRRIVVSNYDSQPLQAGLNQIGMHQKQSIGLLDWGNKSVKPVTKRVEAIWEFGELLDAPATEQLTLFAA